jgi:Pyruvate/2-oxoacid:ferredoxin oxidoreductase delta subunit
MNDETREAIRKSNRERNLRCRKCGAMGLKELDGSKCDGMPGITYKVCDGCGNCQPITKRPAKREKF